MSLQFAGRPADFGQALLFPAIKLATPPIGDFFRLEAVSNRVEGESKQSRRRVEPESKQSLQDHHARPVGGSRIGEDALRKSGVFRTPFEGRSLAGR